MTQVEKNLLSDPQTSGGLLIACAPEFEKELIQQLQAAGFLQTKKIGQFVEGAGIEII